MKITHKLIGLFLLAAGTVSLASCEKTMEPGPGELDMVIVVGESPPTRASMKIDPRADRILREMSEYLKTAREFAFHAEITNDNVGSSGQKIGPAILLGTESGALPFLKPGRPAPHSNDHQYVTD